MEDEGIFGNIDLDGVPDEEREEIKRALLLSKEESQCSQHIGTDEDSVDKFHNMYEGDEQRKQSESPYDINQESTLIPDVDDRNNSGSEIDNVDEGDNKEDNDETVFSEKTDNDSPTTDNVETAYNKETDNDTPSENSSCVQYDGNTDYDSLVKPGLCGKGFKCKDDDEERRPTSQEFKLHPVGTGRDRDREDRKRVLPVKMRKSLNKIEQVKPDLSISSSSSDDETQPPDCFNTIPESQGHFDMDIEDLESDSQPKSQSPLMEQASPPKTPAYLGTVPLKRKYRENKSQADSEVYPLYAPEGVDIDVYVAVIIQQLDRYRQQLKLAQAKLTMRQKWGEPVKVGQHCTKTIDRKCRGQNIQYIDFDHLGDDSSRNESSDNDVDVDFQSFVPKFNVHPIKRKLTSRSASPGVTLANSDQLDSGVLPELNSAVKTYSNFETNICATKMPQRRGRARKVVVEDTQIDHEDVGMTKVEPKVGSSVVLETQEHDSEDNDDWISLPRKMAKNAVKGENNGNFVTDDNFEPFEGHDTSEVVGSDSVGKLNLHQLNVELDCIEENSNASATDFDMNADTTIASQKPARVSKRNPAFNSMPSVNEKSMCGTDRKRRKKSASAIIVEDTQGEVEDDDVVTTRKMKQRRVVKESVVEDVIQESQDLDGDCSIVDSSSLDHRSKVKSWFTRAKQVFEPEIQEAEEKDSQSPVLKGKGKQHKDVIYQQEDLPLLQQNTYDTSKSSQRKGPAKVEKKSQLSLKRNVASVASVHPVKKGVKRLFERPLSKDSNASDVSSVSFSSSAMLDEEGDIYSTQISQIKASRKKIQNPEKHLPNVKEEKTPIRPIVLTESSSSDEAAMTVMHVPKIYSRKKNQNSSWLSTQKTMAGTRVNQKATPRGAGKSPLGDDLQEKVTDLRETPLSKLDIHADCDADSEEDPGPFIKTMSPIGKRLKVPRENQTEFVSKTPSSRQNSSEKSDFLRREVESKRSKQHFVNRNNSVSASARENQDELPSDTRKDEHFKTKHHSDSALCAPQKITESLMEDNVYDADYSRSRKRKPSTIDSEEGKVVQQRKIVKVKKEVDMVPCPLCNRKFPLTEIENHAATCDGLESKEQPERDGPVPDQQRDPITIPEEGEMEVCYICDQPYRKGEPHLDLCIQRATEEQAEVEAQGFQTIFKRQQPIPKVTPRRELRARSMRTNDKQEEGEAGQSTEKVSRH